MLIYENWVLASDGFPNKDMQYKWARKAWDMTSTVASEQFKLSNVWSSWWDLLLRFTSAFANFIRSRLEDLAFVVVSRTSSAAHSKSLQFSSGSSKASISANLDRYNYLMKDKKFHYKVSHGLWIMGLSLTIVGCWNFGRLCIKQYHSWRPSNYTLWARTRKPRHCSSWVVLAVTIVDNCFSFDYCEYPSISSWSHYSADLYRVDFVSKSGRQSIYPKKAASTRSKIYPSI